MDLNLPTYYLDWISSLDLEDPVVFEGRDWYLFSSEELVEEITIDGQSTPTFMQLQSFLSTLKEVAGQSPISMEEGLDCITIGESNGDPLFYKKSDYSLWCYH